MAGNALWLTGENDVLTHLLYATVEISDAKVVIQGRTVFGTLALPDPTAKAVPFVLNPESVDATRQPAVGTVVKVEYSSPLDTYTFLSDIVEVDGETKWRLAFPSMVERSDRRLIRRHRVYGKAGFASDVETSDGKHHALPLYDINTAGLGLVFSPSHVHIAADETLPAVLTVPGLPPFPIRAEVRNIRPLPGDHNHKIAGCRFQGMAPEDHATLATLLARLD